MMYIDGKEKMEDMKNIMGDTSKRFKMATVMALVNTRPVIKFYGETSNATKSYKYLESYIPEIGDKVILIRVGGTYVILGRVV